MELFMKLQGTDCYMNVRNKTDVKMVIVSSHQATNYLLIICFILLDEEIKMIALSTDQIWLESNHPSVDRVIFCTYENAD